MTKEYAYFYCGKSDCKICGKEHYYMTQKHNVIVGSKEELRKVNFPNTNVLLFNSKNTDIKNKKNVYELYPALRK